jgi:hypothetical protein
MFGFRGLRPETPSYVPDLLTDLMQRCWHKDARERPEFSEVRIIYYYLRPIMPDTFDGNNNIKESMTDTFDGNNNIKESMTDTFDGNNNIKESMRNLQKWPTNT